MAAASATDKLQCVVVTPEATVLSAEAEFVALPLYDGEIGILPKRAPLIGRLGFGELRIVSGGQTTSLYVDGGFVQVAANVVSVLTSRAIPATALDAEEAGELLATALQRPGHTDELQAIRERQLLQSRAQLRLARRTAR